MNSPSLTPLFTLLAIVGLTSCSSVKTSMQEATRTMKNLAKTNIERLKNLRFKGQDNNTPSVVAVGKEDLREIKSGKEKILAWNRSRQASRTTAVYLPQEFRSFQPSRWPGPSLVRHSSSTQLGRTG